MATFGRATLAVKATFDWGYVTKTLDSPEKYGLSDLAAGLAPPPPAAAAPPSTAQPEKTSVEPAVTPASSPPVSGPAAGGSSFIKPKDTAETVGVGEPTRAGETTPRNGVKHPTTNAKKVAQAG